MATFPSALILLGGLVAYVTAGNIHEALLESFASGESTRDVIVEFPSVAEKVYSHPSLGGLEGSERHAAIVSMLQSHTQAVQGPMINSLSTFGIKREQVKPFWISNKVAIKGVSMGPLKALSAFPGDFTIREPYKAKTFPMEQVSVQQTDGTKMAQWGVEKIRAPEVWETNNTGQGVVIATIDTGVNDQHIALAANYKNDNCSWLDAFGNYSRPYDGNGHGTHVTGTAVGSANGIGVAPGAQWMACRGLDDEGSGDEVSLTTCGEFMACPCNSTGTCTGMPDIVSNSWGGAVGGQTWFNPVVTAWKNIGIIPVFAIGNSGQLGCFSAGSPGDQPNLISVASTDPDDKLSYFSSRGPSLSNIFGIKPELAAPGLNIVSADYMNNTGYVALSGTSMATPHVAGAVALILSANMDQFHEPISFKDVLNTLSTSAAKPRLGLFSGLNVCSFTLFQQYPNNGYGNGRIDVGNALGV